MVSVVNKMDISRVYEVVVHWWVVKISGMRGADKRVGKDLQIARRRRALTAREKMISAARG